MPNHPASITLALISMVLNGISIAADKEDAGYPAPPGVYGQEKLLDNAHFNLGKGSPYIILENTDNQLQDTTAQQADITPQDSSPPRAPLKETPVISQGQSLSSEIPIYQKPPMAAPSSPEPPAPQQEKHVFYPEPEAMRQQYLQAKSLPFDHWGHETLEYGDPTVPINTSPNWQTYPDRQADRQTQHYVYPGNLAGSLNPNAANYLPYPTQKEAGFANPGYIMNQFFNSPANTDWAASSNPYLAPFEQFPVPQNPYGFSSATSSMQRAARPAGTNLQYLPKIPEQEIIYPPSYPGKRPGN